jgi:hypothetical protein
MNNNEMPRTASAVKIETIIQIKIGFPKLLIILTIQEEFE